MKVEIGDVDQEGALLRLLIHIIYASTFTYLVGACCSYRTEGRILQQLPYLVYLNNSKERRILKETIGSNALVICLVSACTLLPGEATKPCFLDDQRSCFHTKQHKAELQVGKNPVSKASLLCSGPSTTQFV